MHLSGKRSWLVLGGVFLAVLALLAVILYPEAKNRWISPLGPGLDLPTSPSLAGSQAGVEDNAPEAGNALQTLPTAEFSSLSTTIESTEIPQPLCGGPPSMTILALGVDSSVDYIYGLADVIRIVRIDFTTPSVVVFALPRDLWVEIPEIDDNYGITHGKLNQAYFYGTPGMGYYEGPGAGAGLLARTLELNFGLHVDHYTAVNMQAFVNIVDAVGGIDIYLPSDVDGRPFEGNPEDMGYFPAGQNHFNGEQALRLSRIRKKYNDFIRMDHQNLVLCSLKEKITSPAVLPKIPQIIAALQDSVLTDLSLEQLAQLACLAPKLKPENLIFTGLPQEILSSGQVYSSQLKDETFILEADFDIIQDYTSQFMTGPLPADLPEPTCP